MLGNLTTPEANPNQTYSHICLLVKQSEHGYQQQETNCYSLQPPSPIRTTFAQPPPLTYNPYPYQPPGELLQRLQAYTAYSPPQPSFAPYTYPSYSPFQYPPVFNPTVVPQVNSYTLQPPPQKKLPPSPLALRHQQPQHHQTEDERSSSRSASTEGEPHFIRPLSQVGTLTTTDADGRVRVIVPVPSGAEDAGELLRAIRLRDEEFPRPIQRTVSEKVPNRSELMSQVQRTAWARHTTK